MNKRDRVLKLLDETATPSYVPAAFFLHFPVDCHRGQAAIDKHLEYYRYTGMDLLKIQYEFPFPHRPEIRTPDDWARMPSYGRAFYQDQLDVVAGLVEAAKAEATVVLTLYSPFMSAGSTSQGAVTEHLKQDPGKVVKGLEIITESLLWFVRECIRLGLDGFYTSTQGGEAYRFDDPTIFAQYIKPYDLAIWGEIDRACPFNILHICDYNGGYDDLTPFLDYPGDVVNSPLTVGDETMTPAQAAAFFGRPYMGGLDRHGIIVDGTETEIASAVQDVLRDAPERFILGADCTLPGDIDWGHIKAAIDTAHAHAQ
jgi:uroporphyrinogen decarboxylase